MSAPVSDPLDVPPNVRQVLSQLVSAAKLSFANNLHSLVLYGSAAEGRLRPTSDVNPRVALDALEAAQAGNALPARLLQPTRNLTLRLRAEYAHGHRDEQLAFLAAHAARALRAAAAPLLESESPTP